MHTKRLLCFPLFCCCYSSARHNQESVWHLEMSGEEMNEQQLMWNPSEFPADPHFPESRWSVSRVRGQCVCGGGRGGGGQRLTSLCSSTSLPFTFEVLCLSKLRTCTLWLVYLVSLPWGPHLSPVCWNCRWLPCLPSFYLVSGDQTSLQDTYFIHWVFSPAQHFILNHRLTLLDAPLWGQCDLLKEAWLHSFSSPGEGGVRLSSGKR